MEQFTLCKYILDAFWLILSIVLFCRSNMVGNLLPWDGNNWEMSSEILEDEYQVQKTLLLFCERTKVSGVHVLPVQYQSPSSYNIFGNDYMMLKSKYLFWDCGHGLWPDLFVSRQIHTFPGESHLPRGRPGDPRMCQNIRMSGSTYLIAIARCVQNSKEKWPWPRLLMTIRGLKSEPDEWYNSSGWQKMGVGFKSNC